MTSLDLTIHTLPGKTCVVDRIPFSIGSHADNHLVVDVPGVDSFHVCVLWQANQYVLMDLASTSGTRIVIIRFVFKARSLIDSIHSNYGSMFEVDLLRHGLSMISLIGGILLLLFVAQAVKG